MSKKVEDLNVLLYIIEGDGHTITEASKHFGISRLDIRNIINRLNDCNDSLYDVALMEETNEKLSNALKKARSYAGSKSSKTKKITEDQALSLRFKNLYAKIPLRTLAKDLDCSFMTIANAINKLPKSLTDSQDEMFKKLRTRVK